MKSIKSKLLHKSFITNQDLIEGIRNQSFVSSRHPSARLHTEKSHISLLKKKSYERLHTDKENISQIANEGTKQRITSISDKAITMLQDCLTSLGDSHLKIQHKLKKVLGYVREMVEEKSKIQIDLKRQADEVRMNLSSKISDYQVQSSRLRKNNEDLKLKLGEYRQKILNLRYQVKPIEREKAPAGLHEIIINQSQIIDQQCDQNQQQTNQMRRMLNTQALKIEEMLGFNSKNYKKADLSDQTSLGNSFLKRNR